MSLRSSFSFSFSLSFVLLFVLLSLCGHLPYAHGEISATGEATDQEFFETMATNYLIRRDDLEFTYTPGSTRKAIDAYASKQEIYFPTHGVLDPADRGNLTQIPLTASALVMAYNLGPAIAANSFRLVFDKDTLAGVWSGEITWWRDPAILALNSPIAGLLPDANITLVYSEDVGGSITAALRAYLFSDGSAWPNAMKGIAANDSTLRAQTAAATLNSLTYLGISEVPSTLLAARMQRGASTVTANLNSISAAVGEYAMSYLNEGDKVVNMVPTSLATSWPMTYVVYGTINEVTETSIQCLFINEYIIWVSWMLLNDQIAIVAQGINHVIMPVEIKTTILSSLSSIVCQGQQVSTTAYIVGSGSANPLPTLGHYYSGGSFTLKYFIGNSAASTANLVRGTTDFGQTSGPISAADLSAMPDVITVPAWVWAIAPCYNLPELYDYPPLKMNWTVISDIYMAKILYWDDPAIKELNPLVKDLLPHSNITIVYQINESVVTANFNTAMSMVVPEYNATIGPGGSMAGSPAIQQGRGSGVNGFAYPERIRATPYSFGISSYQHFTFDARPIQMWNIAGNLVSPTPETILSAINDYAGKLDLISFPNGPGANSWPISLLTAVLVRSRSMTDCVKAKVLADWLYWMQTSETGTSIIDSSSYIAAYSLEGFQNELRRKVVNITCKGEPVSVLAGCVSIDDGLICSGHGECSQSGQCLCNDGWQGARCEIAKSSASDDALAIGLGVSLPLSLLICLIFLALLALIAFLLFRRRNQPADSEYYIDVEELELGDMLGKGGFGEVYKAQWRGNEVAVKLLPPEACTKRESREAFVTEMGVMSKLRHPNVVLFMAACRKPPKMCIVMEYMSLGSLYDLLHNELVPDLPMLLKAKLAYQAAKGMHFLHSSGIVHRDLKSLNLLLDNKWNLKVSDFGLTALKDSIQSSDDSDQQMVCSVPWTAPEVLERYHRRRSQNGGLDFVMADVYSFGIVLWELLTRESPYLGLSAPQIAVSVIRDGARPALDETHMTESEYVRLMQACWHADPISRPVFMDVMNSLQKLCDQYSCGTSSFYGSRTTASSSASSSGLHSHTTTASSDDGKADRMLIGDSVPTRDVSFAVFDLAKCDELWRTRPMDAERCIEQYLSLVKRSVYKYNGYIFSNATLHSGGTIMASFHGVDHAVLAAARVQRKFTERSRVSIHFHAGPSPTSLHKNYPKENYEEACRLTVVCPEGLLLVSPATAEVLRNQPALLPTELTLNEWIAEEDAPTRWRIDWDGCPKAEPIHAEENTAEYEQLGLCSSNRCPWIIDSNRISEGVTLGHGSYGSVSEAMYFGTKVAIKRLYNSRLTETQMLSMRREAALLSELTHPNIVSLIGMSIGPEGPLLVMELVSKGSLDRILYDKSFKLSWPRRLRMLRDAAVGISYLHSRGIIHRDIKSSNLLLDDNYNVKVGDFGFATAKQEDCTMTRCGTPAWTAPEMMSGKGGASNMSYDEKVDVYSFAIVMWETLTRRHPFSHAQKNGGGLSVAFDIISGDRPPIPDDADPAFADLMRRCWHNKATKRPTMDEVVVFLNSAVGSHDSV